MKKIIAMAVFLACCAVGQQVIPMTQQQGFGAPPTGLCSSTANVGNFWNQLGTAANGFTGPYICVETTSTAPNQFSWVPLQQQSGTATTGTLSVASGKAAVISNSLTFAGTDATTITFPSTSITVPGTIYTNCGSSASCASPATVSASGKVAVGTIAFSAATTATITGISPAFTSSSSFTCYASDPSHAYTITLANQSSSSVTLTAGTSNSDTWNWACIGY